jgi:hypothetical protein
MPALCTVPSRKLAKEYPVLTPEAASFGIAVSSALNVKDGLPCGRSFV